MSDFDRWFRASKYCQVVNPTSNTEQIARDAWDAALAQPKENVLCWTVISTTPKEGNSMENQHRKIAGYRELSQEEIDLMNKVKAMGPQLQELVDALRANKALDQRWISIGSTHLQQGLMALTRGVAQPTFF